jgi:signal transduction histidine kinase
VVYVGGTAALLIFATGLSLRIRRLRDEAEKSIDAHGRVLGTVGGSMHGDELGDLARSFADILRRLQQYTGYLETLAGRLSHELRTPVAVVRSSLDNLKQVELPGEARVYLQRAEEGLARLSTIFTRMSEATRLEQSLATVEREKFDLATVVRGCVEGYRLAHRDRQFSSTRRCPYPINGRRTWLHKCWTSSRQCGGIQQGRQHDPLSDCAGMTPECACPYQTRAATAGRHAGPAV